ncbi:LysR family transcriptional regulator [Herbaspirillum sp. alder98]|uniref:LysR family transcriptional regulator n=1 Tax=Herbaspirillum sp. alder98 TaxID=2913096 RepID=UPI001CD88746|nr:LysR family transcriptional regulator [Herbaspirillum sp. alder98]MCA1326715.1 LysR family transcriptional regulator [Herbaspirillum sp. alder98]
MKQMNIATVDLNLLKTFIAIWEERSLTTAAERLHLTQPAVSHALRRLREMFDDPLFVRTPTAMVPTDAAVRLHTPIANALTIIHDALQNHAHFDPATASRTFRMVMSDMSSAHVLPLLMERLAQSAPRVSFEVEQMPIEALSAAMRNGDIDLAFGYLPGLSDDCVSQTVLYDEYICMLRRAHPLAGAPLTMDTLTRLRYVYTATNTTGHKLAEDVFRKAGIRRDIALRIPHFTVAPQIVLKTDLALILPRSIAEQVNLARDCVLLDLPLPMPRIPVRLHTHTRFAADPGIAWLRDTLAEMFGREEPENPAD